MPKHAAIIDIDGTIADLEHRLHFIKNGKKDWDSFFEACSEDKVIEPVATLVDFILACDGSVKHSEILFVSGRPEKIREKTVNWLELEAQFQRLPYSLYMRKDGDFRPDTVVKSEILDQILSEGYEVLFAVDDRPSVIAMWRNRGIFVFQVQSHWAVESLAENRGQLTLMVGPTGAGKSTWLENAENLLLYKISSAEVVSSDKVREDLFGNFLDQSDNDKVFRIVHNLAKARIESGLNATVDATNLRRRDRRAAIEATNPSHIRYIIMDRPLEEKLNTAGWRSGVPGLIEKHHIRFQSGLKEILGGDSLGAEIIDVRKG